MVHLKDQQQIQTTRVMVVLVDVLPQQVHQHPAAVVTGEEAVVELPRQMAQTLRVLEAALAKAVLAVEVVAVLR